MEIPLAPLAKIQQKQYFNASSLHSNEQSVCKLHQRRQNLFSHNSKNCQDPTGQRNPEAPL
jgi:hypothetical protein